MDIKQLLEYYNKYRIIIFPAVTAVAALILIGVIIVPQLFKLIENNETYTTMNNTNTFLDAKAQELTQIDNNALKNKVDLSFLALPANKDLAEVIGLLQKIVSDSGLILASLQFGKDSAVDGQQAFRVIIEVQGLGNSFALLMDNIERTYRPMKIDSVEISSPRASLDVTATLNIDVFYTPVPKSIGGLEAPLPKLTAKDEEVIAGLAKYAPKGVTVETNFVAGPRGRENPFE